MSNLPDSHIPVPVPHAPSPAGGWNARDTFHAALDALALVAGPLIALATPLVNSIDTSTVEGFALAGFITLGLQILRRWMQGPSPGPKP